MKKYVKKIISFSLLICMLFSISEMQMYVKATDIDETKNIGKKRIDRISDLESTYIALDEKLSLNNVKKLFPSSLKVRFEGERKEESIAVEWKCEEDYIHTQYKQYIFKPVIDETQYELSDNYDRETYPFIEVSIDEKVDESQEKNEVDEADEDSINMMLEMPMEGDGTAESPYLITTPEQLDAVRNNLSGCYQLQNDIDLWGCFDNGWKPIGDRANPFTGIFDGNGYRIVGLEKLEGSGDTVLDTAIEPRGLFSCMSDGTIMNLGLVTENGKTFNGTAKSTTSGLLLGKGSGKIINCYAIGDVKSEKGIAVGLLAGEFSGNMERCWSKGSIDAEDPWWGSMGRVSVGGIVGEADGNIINCYSICDINARVGSIVSQTSHVGGIVGNKLSGRIEIENCYFSGDLRTGGEALQRVGGIIACFEYENPDMSKYNVASCYFNSDTTSITSEIDSNLVSKLGIPKTADEMKNRNTYEEWNFENIWQLGAYMNDGYPYFKNTDEIYINGERVPIDEEELFINYPGYLNNSVTKTILETVYDANSAALSIYDIKGTDKLISFQYAIGEGGLTIILDTYAGKVVNFFADYFNNVGLHYSDMQERIVDQMTKDIVNELVENEDVLGNAARKCSDKLASVRKLSGWGEKIEKTFWIKEVRDTTNLDEKTINQIYESIDGDWEEFSSVLSKAGSKINKFEAATQMLWTVLLPKEVISELRLRLPDNSDLAQGLDRLLVKVNHYPFEEKYQKTVQSIIGKMAELAEKGFLNFTGWSKGSLTLAQFILDKAISYSPFSNADEYVRVLAYDGAAINIRSIYLDIMFQYARKNSEGIITPSAEVKQDINNYKKYFDLYLSVLSKEVDKMRGISEGSDVILYRLDYAQKGIGSLDSDKHIWLSVREARKDWMLKYTKRNGVISIAGDASSNISAYTVQSSIDAVNDSILYIPGELEGNPVKTILPYAFAGNSTVKIVVIGEGVEEIGEGAFADCSNLEYVLFPSSLKNIKAGAFANCVQITNVEIPEGLENIDIKAFDNNSSLTIFAEMHSKAADYARNMKYELIEIESQVENVEISKYPDKVEFSSDEEIDLSGMELLITYMNGEKKTVNDNWIMLDGLLKEDPANLQIQYMATRLSIPIILNANSHEYCIKYVDIYGNSLAEEKKGKALFGEKIVEKPIEIEGYTASNEMFSFIIGNKNNVFNILYYENAKINLEKGGSIDKIKAQEMTGAEITPNVVVKYDDQILIKDKDYMIIYIDNIDVGTATVLAAGLNEYEGIISSQFIIEKTGSSLSNNKNKAEESNLKLEKRKKDEVNTGDDADILLWTIFLVISIAYCLVYKKYKSKR